MRPARISASSALATWSESLALGLTAENGEDMEWVGRERGAGCCGQAVGAMDFTRRALCRKGLLAALLIDPAL
jgi:hypothetical protein